MGVDHDFIVIGNTSIAICSLLILCLITNYTLHSCKIRWLPESVVMMAVGALAGLGLVLFSKNATDVTGYSFDGKIFFFALLPPIILEAGYTLKRKDFFKNIFPILLFAVVGTLLASFLTGFALYELRTWAEVPDLSLLDCLLFGTVLSATESVAVLALLGNKERPSDPLLYSLVFGESVFNDAVCIVLYEALYGYVSTPFTSDALPETIGLFFGVAIGSIALGGAVGLLCSFLFKRLHLHTQPDTEFLIIVSMAFVSYCVAEVTGLSGVMSLFFCALTLAHYNWYNISEETRSSTLHGFTAIAKGAEAVVFIYLGVTFSLSFHPSSGLAWSPKLCVLSIGLCVATRILYIVPFSAVDNFFFRKQGNKITWPMQLVMIVSGMRGSVCFALVLNLPKTPENTNSMNKLVTTTLMVCLVTLVFGGMIVDRMLAYFGLVGGSSGRNHMLGGHENLTLYGGSETGARDIDMDSRDIPIHSVGSSTWFKWRKLDDNLFKPMFGGRLTDRAYRLDDPTPYGAVSF